MFKHEFLLLLGEKSGHELIRFFFTDLLSSIFLNFFIYLYLILLSVLPIPREMAADQILQYFYALIFHKIVSYFQTFPHRPSQTEPIFTCVCSSHLFSSETALIKTLSKVSLYWTIVGKREGMEKKKKIICVRMHV